MRGWIWMGFGCPAAVQPCTLTTCSSPWLFEPPGRHSASRAEPLCKHGQHPHDSKKMGWDGGVQSPLVRPSVCPAPELMPRPQRPRLSRPSLLSLPPDSSLLKPVHSFQALQLDLFILAVISVLSSAYKFQGHSMLTLG